MTSSSPPGSLKRAMTTMTKTVLMERLSEYGYPLLEPAPKPEQVLEALLEEEDARLLEGFPVVFANILRSGEALGWEGPSWKPESLSVNARRLLPYLLAASLVLFEKERLEPHLVSRAAALLAGHKDGSKVRKEVGQAFAAESSFKAAGREFSTGRLESVFKNYMALKPGGETPEQKKEAMARELLLSRLFTPRQKMLLRKKLEGADLSKTEREYYSRVLKKRLQALVSEEVHALAKKLLGK